MTDEYLKSKGWHLVATKHVGANADAKLWTHAEYQRDDGRFFTKTQAMDTQRHLDKPWKFADVEGVCAHRVP